MVASAVVCEACTSAPTVTEERPMRPEIGASTLVYSRLRLAARRLASYW
jgi:hypothetical protein